MKFSWKGGELHRLSFKYTWVHVRVLWSKLARRGELKHELECTWVKTAQGALCRQVLRSRACEAEENLSAKCTECSFTANVNEEVAKYTDAELARRGVLGLPLSWHWDESVEVLPLFWSTSYAVLPLSNLWMWISTCKASEGQFCEVLGQMCIKCEVQNGKMWVFLETRYYQTFSTHSSKKLTNLPFWGLSGQNSHPKIAQWQHCIMLIMGRYLCLHVKG